MKKERNTFLLVCSMVLIAACLMSLFSGVKGINDVMNIKEYKTEQKDEGLKAIDTAISGINQLKENEKTYLTGVGTYTSGLSAYAAGQQQLADAAAKLSQGEADYAAGKSKLDAGKAQYAAGKAQLDANTDAYNQGKQKLAMAEALAGAGEALGVGDPLGLNDKITDGKAQLKQYEDGQQQLAAAEKQIATGEQSLAQGKQTLTNGYAQYNAGVDKLNQASSQLASGRAKLSVFEDGMAQLADGMETLMNTEAIVAHDGVTVVVPGVADRLPDDFSYWALNDDGSIKTVNGCQYLNLDNCMKVCKAGQDFIADQGDSVTAELTGRVLLYFASFVVCLLGAIAGIMGADAAFAPKRIERTAFLGMACAILAVGANVYGFIGHYTGYTYPLDDGSYSGNLQFYSLIALAAAALVFSVAAYSALSNYKDTLAAAGAAGNTAAGSADGEPVGAVEASSDDIVVDSDAGDTVVTAQAPAAEAAPAVTVADTAIEDAPAGAGNREKLHNLEREEAELKQMLSSLTSKINDLKHQEI